MNEIRIIEAGGVVSARGFSADAARGGIKTNGDDVALIVAEQSATAAAVFTRNAFKAAPVLVCADHAATGRARAIVTNAGNANCCTGAQGLAAARRTCELVAAKIGCRAADVLVCSTGVIGHQLPMEKVEAAIGSLELQAGEAINETIARAIMTTDTRPKFCAAQTTIDGRTVTVGGTVKGVGMIGPDMGPLHATLLCFLTTDADVPQSLLQSELEQAVEKSFNSVTVDGDTSTNDSCILLASGASEARITENNMPVFRALLETVCVRLAREVAADGEGATKLVTVAVENAATEADAKHVAMTVANSPLVKTAIFGQDPNWGRIAAAVGRSGVTVNPKVVAIRLNNVEVFHHGEPTSDVLATAEAAMTGPELTISIDMGSGAASWTAWTCDFSYDYVKINAEYHT